MKIQVILLSLLVSAISFAETKSVECGHVQYVSGVCPELRIAYDFEPCDPGAVSGPEIKCDGKKAFTLTYRTEKNTFVARFKEQKSKGNSNYVLAGPVTQTPGKNRLNIIPPRPPRQIDFAEKVVTPIRK